jgi:hypothetical protein
MGITISLTTTAAIAERLAAKLQAECLKVRKQLFYDSKSGFSHNVGGVRTEASAKVAEACINNISGCLIRFKFRSHRMLWFTIQGVSKRYILASPNQFDYDTVESDETNPYLKIKSELLKAASEMRKMEVVFNELANAA